MTQSEQLATIRRICCASGIRAEALTAVEAVKLLAREHAATRAMVATLHRQVNAPVVHTMYTSEPIR